MTKAHLFFNNIKWELLEPGDLFIPYGLVRLTPGILAAGMASSRLGGVEGLMIKSNNTDCLGYGWVWHVCIVQAAERPKVNPISDEQRAKRRGRNSKA